MSWLFSVLRNWEATAGFSFVHAMCGWVAAEPFQAAPLCPSFYYELNPSSSEPCSSLTKMAGHWVRQGYRQGEQEPGAVPFLSDHPSTCFSEGCLPPGLSHSTGHLAILPAK